MIARRCVEISSQSRYKEFIWFSTRSHDGSVDLLSRKRYKAYMGNLDVLTLDLEWRNTPSSRLLFGLSFSLTLTIFNLETDFRGGEYDYNEKRGICTKTHSGDKEVIDSFSAGAILIIRNPRKVAVSNVMHQKITNEDSRDDELRTRVQHIRNNTGK